MAYIGRDISNLSDRAVLDNITTSATATYNLLLNSVAFVPSSAESLTVSLNGVIQKPQSSYTVSGSTIVFDSALTSSDSIDFILAERAITLTTVGSGSVGTSQLADDAVTYAKTDGSFGKIGQVLHTTTSTQVALTSSAYTDLGLQQAITPSSTSSKILIFANIHSQYQDSGQNSAYTMKMLRDSTQVYTGGQLYEITSETANATGQQKDSWTFFDSPSSTSAITYKVQVSTFNNSDVTFQRGGFFQSELLLMEVLA